MTRRDAFRRLDHSGAVAGRLDEARQPALEAEAVDDDELCGRDGLRIRWCRRIDMGVAVRTDERCEVDAVTADIANEISEHGEACHHAQLVIGVRARTKQAE